MNLHNILKVYRRDWKAIVKNPVAIIILLGLCVIPSLYAWVNIQACWNIYENTGTIPVAVVNNDKAATYRGKTINIGSDVVKQLKKNHNIQWVFVGSKEANLGLVDSTYYAMIEIPPDFSSRFLTVLTDHPQKPQITYKLDTKVNPVANKITDTAKNSLVQEITTNFVSTVNETVFSSLNTVGKDADQNKEDLIKLKDSIVNINTNMDTVTNAMDAIGSNSDNLSQFLDSISATMPAVQSGLQAVGKSNADNLAILQSTQSQFNDSVKNVDLNLGYAQSSNNRIRELFNNLNQSLSSADTSKINSVLPAVGVELDSLNNSIDATIEYLQECGSYDYNSDIDQAITSLQNLKTSLATLRQGLVELQQQLNAHSQDLDQLYAFLGTAIPKLEQQITDLDQALGNTIAVLTDLNQTYPSSDLTRLISTLQSIRDSKLLSTLTDLLEEIKDSEPTVKNAIASLNSEITSAIKQIDTASTQIDAAVRFLKSVKSGNEVKKAQLTEMTSALRKIKPYISDEQAQFSYLQQQLNSANSVGKSIADTVNRDAGQISAQLNRAVTLYNSGVRDDLNIIGSNLVAATQNAGELIRSAQDLSTQVNGMVRTARDGAALASEFSGDVSRRLKEFRDVIRELGGQLELVNNGDIMQIISILQSNPKLMGEFISTPFDIKTESINAIPNYGSSMAPLYTTLALWVGCLLLNSILKIRVGYFPGLEKLTLRERHFGKMLIFNTLAVIQGLIVSLGDVLILKIYTVNAPLFVIFAVVSSLVYSIVTYTLVSTLGNIGKALSIIYMILQLAGSGGSYPIQVDPVIFRILQPLFPFTYTVNGLREAVAGPLVNSVVINFVALSLFAVVFLISGFFLVKPLNAKIHRFEYNFKESGIGE